MKYGSRVDSNQAEVVRALRSVGAVVVSLAEVGNGCPDIIVGFRGATWLMEIKRPRRKGQPAGSLNELQRAWHAAWAGGPLVVVRTAEEALGAIGVEVKAA